MTDIPTPSIEATGAPASAAPATRPAGRLRAALARLHDVAVTPAGFWILLLLYLAAHFLLRWWSSPNIGSDEVEQALFSQDWALGYNPRQPPLFTWLLRLAYELLGTGVVAHLTVKYATLGLTYGFAYLCARRLLESRALAALATLSLVTLYGFGWGAHTGYTHTLTLTAAIFACLWSFLRLAERRRAGDYLLFGLLAGLGLLTKYSFGLFVGPLLLAALALSGWRAALLDRRMGAALAAALVVFLPHAAWMLTNGADYAETLKVLGDVHSQPSWGGNVALGLGSLVKATAFFLAPFWILLLLALGPEFRRIAAPKRPGLRLLLLTIAIGMALLVATVLIAEVTYFKERRMHAVLLVAPLALFAWLDHGAPDPRRLRRMGAMVLGVVVIGLGATLGQGLFEPWTCRRCWLHMPLPALEAAIRETGFARGTIVTAEEHVGGNLRLAFPGARVLTPTYMTLMPPAPATGTCLLAWHARLQGDPLPPLLAAYLRDRLGLVPDGTPVWLDLPMRRRPGRIDRYAFQLVPNADAACRPR